MLLTQGFRQFQYHTEEQKFTEEAVVRAGVLFLQMMYSKAFYRIADFAEQTLQVSSRQKRAAHRAFLSLLAMGPRRAFNTWVAIAAALREHLDRVRRACIEWAMQLGPRRAWFEWKAVAAEVTNTCCQHSMCMHTRSNAYITLLPYKLDSDP